MENKWHIKQHSYQIGDTGDYDGYNEITNGVISLGTKDDDEETVEVLLALAGHLNAWDINLFDIKADDLSVDNHLLKEENAALRARNEKMETYLQKKIKGYNHLVKTIEYNLEKNIYKDWYDEREARTLHTVWSTILKILNEALAEESVQPINMQAVMNKTSAKVFSKEPTKLTPEQVQERKEAIEWIRNPDKERYDKLVDILDEARLQIEYLHKKYGETGSGNNILARISAVIDSPPLADLTNIEYRGPGSHCKACEDEKNGVKHIMAQKHTCRKK